MAIEILSDFGENLESIWVFQISEHTIQYHCNLLRPKASKVESSASTVAHLYMMMHMYKLIKAYPTVSTTVPLQTEGT